MVRLLLASALWCLTCQSDLVSVFLQDVICYQICFAFSMCLTRYENNFSKVYFCWIISSQTKERKHFDWGDAKYASENHSQKHTRGLAVAMARPVCQLVGQYVSWSTTSRLKFCQNIEVPLLDRMINLHNNLRHWGHVYVGLQQTVILSRYFSFLWLSSIDGLFV